MSAVTYVLCGSYAEFDLWTRSVTPYLQGPTKHSYFGPIYDRNGADQIQSMQRNMFYIVLEGFYSLREDDRTYIKIQVGRRYPIKIATLDLQPSFVPTLVIR